MDTLLSLIKRNQNRVTFKAPAYIQKATRRKYGLNIFVIGVSSEDLEAFQNGISYHTLGTTVPVERGRAVVDIDCKSHTNAAEEEDDDDIRSDKKPEDWYDEFEITSKKGSNQNKSKSYRLQWGSNTTKTLGGSLGLNVGGSGFFNMAAASAGISGSYSKTTSKSEEENQAEGESLSQEYQVVDALKVPPKTKVAAMITTWAVTYESDTTTEVTVDATNFLPVHYRTMLSRRVFGGIFSSTGVLTAHDLFGNEEDYKYEDYVVTFKRQGKISYLGEEVEIIKRKTPV